MPIDEFERYVISASPEVKNQLLFVGQVPSFRDALVSCIRKIEEQIIALDPHEEDNDKTLLKVYRQLYNERSLYQDFLNGIERLRRDALEQGIIPEPSSAHIDLGSIENVAPPREASR